MAAADFDPEDAVAFWDVTNRQDWHVCEQMQLGLRSRAYRPGPYSHREDLLHGFDQLILELERKAMPRPAPAKRLIQASSRRGSAVAADGFDGAFLESRRQAASWAGSLGWWKT